MSMSISSMSQTVATKTAQMALKRRNDRKWTPGKFVVSFQIKENKEREF